ncbi:MAG: hypothetical protein KGJ86_13445 [Chloroflexota bacterium]|nr:hypothetical protein [Chloroflexota bacterium]
MNSIAHTGALYPPEARCPVPQVHRRLEEAHRFWHQAADAYTDPEPFRSQLNSAVQALRSCVWMLQKRTRSLLDFETWHASWHEAITDNEVLSWLMRAGNQRVGADELEKASSAQVRLMVAHKLPLTEFSVPPLMPTRDIALSLTGRQVPPGTPNPHYLAVRRRWAVEGLPGWELMDGLSQVYAVLAALLADAHHPSGDELVEGETAGKTPRRRIRLTLGPLPCMELNDAVRTVVLNLRTGRLQGQYSQWIERDREVGNLVAQRFGGVEHLHQALIHQDRDPLYFTAKYFEDAKRALLQQKMHRQAVHVFSAAGQWVPLTIDPRHEDNYSIWQRIAEEVRRNGAEAVLMVCEVQPPAKIEPSRTQAALTPPRRETLVLVAETADGRHRTLTVPFSRRGDQIRFGRTRVEQDGRRWHQLEPVRAVWRR